jgi:hypothetical protein
MSSDDSYAYTTIYAAPGEPTTVGVSFYLNEDAWIRVCTTSKDRPLLTVQLGHVSVQIAPRTGQLTAQDAAIARHFADQAALYAAEVERRCNAQASGPAAA